MNNTLYVRSTDVYDVSRELKKSKAPKYREDFSKAEWEDIENVKEKVKLYIPREAIQFIDSNPIKIVKVSPFRRDACFIDNQNIPTLQVHGIPIKEYEKKYIYLLGKILCNYSPNTRDKTECEYEDIIPLILEYLYLMELGKESTFKSEHLHDLYRNSKNYIKIYQKYYEDILKDSKKISSIADESEALRFEWQLDNKKESFVLETLNYLVKLSSLDVVLDVIDDFNDELDFKSILKMLIENKNHDRTGLVNDMGLCAYNFTNIRKELVKK